MNLLYKVDHVPFLLAKFAELTSSIGYHTTVAVEKAMHVPNDICYNSTGMIFGADNAMDINRYQINNGNLAQNLKNFCHQCVLYDIHLGRYSIDELKKATDLWQFLSEKTSNVGMMQYMPIGEKEQKGDYLTCREAIQKMTPYFEQEKRYYGQLDICKNLGLSFQALTGMQKETEELIGQQLMMNVLSDEYKGNNFAKARAYAQQRSTYQVLGSLASGSLVTLRAIIEALVYASFIFIFPLSVLPGGIKFITTWIGLVLWIQLWPPFYAVLNYIMQSISHGYSESIFHGLPQSHLGLSLFTSMGLNHLQQDIFALSGYLAASIPFITYAIIKGGVGSFVHLASSMMSPAHSASATAASEQTTGNYSFGNTSFGQTSYKNTTALQHNVAPSLTGGFFHENSGQSSVIYGQNEQILRQSNSELRTSLFSDDSISQSLQTSKMHAQSTAEHAQQNYTEGLSTHSRNLVDLSNHLAHSENYSQGMTEKEAYDLQESARYFQNSAESWGKQHGLNSRTSMELLAGVGLSFLGNGVKASTIFGSNKEETLSAAHNFVKSEEFQKHFQKIQDIASSQGYGHLDESGNRLVESYNQSYENLQSSQQTLQVAQSELNQISENATWAEQNSHLIRHSLNQDFINWASDQYAQQGGFAKVEELLTKEDSSIQSQLITPYIEHLKKNQPHLHLQNYEDPNIMALKTLPAVTPSSLNQIQEFASKNKENFATISEKKQAVTDTFFKSQIDHQQQFSQARTDIESANEIAHQNFDKEADQSIYLKPLATAAKEGIFHLNKLKSLQHPDSNISGIVTGFQIKQKPFWIK